MKSSRFWLAVLVGGVVANVMDYLVYGRWLSNAYFMKNPVLFNNDPGNIPWFIVGDFVAVLVFAWIYDRVSSSFGSTPMDGAKAGLYLGVFANFPLGIYMHLMFNGYPYGLSWISMVYGVIWCVVVGAVLAAMMKKGSMAAA